jgi:hypothetical protein
MTTFLYPMHKWVPDKYELVKLGAFKGGGKKYQRNFAKFRLNSTITAE